MLAVTRGGRYCRLGLPIWTAGDRVFYQMMEGEDPTTFDKWTAHWDHLEEFEKTDLKDKRTGA